MNDDSSVCSSYNESVLLGVVLVLVLLNESSSGIVVSLSLSSSSVLDLISLVICFGFEYFDEGHCLFEAYLIINDTFRYLFILNALLNPRWGLFLLISQFL